MRNSCEIIATSVSLFSTGLRMFKLSSAWKSSLIRLWIKKLIKKIEIRKLKIIGFCNLLLTGNHVDVVFWEARRVAHELVENDGEREDELRVGRDLELNLVLVAFFGFLAKRRIQALKRILNNKTHK